MLCLLEPAVWVSLKVKTNLLRMAPTGFRNVLHSHHQNLNSLLKNSGNCYTAITVTNEISEFDYI